MKKRWGFFPDGRLCTFEEILYKHTGCGGLTLLDIRYPLKPLPSGTGQGKGEKIQQKTSELRTGRDHSLMS